MINIHLHPQDLVGIRFAYSPLVEAVISYRMLQKPHQQGWAFQDWADKVLPHVQGMDFAYLDAVMTPDYIADFLMPTPLAPMRQFADELQRLRATPEDCIRDDMSYITRIASNTPVRQFFLDQPRAAIECLIDELALYWERALADYWRQIIPILDNEILYRARDFALNGAGEALNELAHNVCFNAGILRIDKLPAPSCSNEHFMGGRGLQLVPSMFKTQSSSHIRQLDRSMILYPARGIGLLQVKKKPQAVDASLNLLLGEGKTRILYALTQPLHTQELARKLHVSAGGISQHLQRLHEAGLVETYRSGYYVFYRLSTRGEKLLELFNE